MSQPQPGDEAATTSLKGSKSTPSLGTYFTSFKCCVKSVLLCNCVVMLLCYFILCLSWVVLTDSLFTFYLAAGSSAFSINGGVNKLKRHHQGELRIKQILNNVMITHHHIQSYLLSFLYCSSDSYSFCTYLNYTGTSKIQPGELQG